MKNIFLLLLAVFTSTISIAKDKKAPFIGEWMITTIETNGKPNDMYTDIAFKEEGNLEINGRVFGKWSFDKKTKSIWIQTKMIRELAGEKKIVSLNDNEMVIEGNKIVVTLRKLDSKNSAKINKKSDLKGKWKLSNQKTIIFSLPNKCVITEKINGNTNEIKGLWTYFNNDETLIIQTLDKELNGESKFKNKSKNKFTITHKGETLKATKQ